MAHPASIRHGVGFRNAIDRNGTVEHTIREAMEMCSPSKIIFSYTSSLITKVIGPSQGRPPPDVLLGHHGPGGLQGVFKQDHPGLGSYGLCDRLAGEPGVRSRLGAHIPGTPPAVGCMPHRFPGWVRQYDLIPSSTMEHMPMKMACLAGVIMTFAEVHGMPLSAMARSATALQFGYPCRGECNE